VLLAPVLLLVLVAGPAAADTSLYESDVARIEARAAQDPDTVRDDAAALRATLQERIRTLRGFAEKSADQARQWRELAENALADAARNEGRATHFEKEARDPLFDERARTRMAEWVADYRRDAAADRARAEERNRNAVRLRRESEARLDEVAELEALVARLEAAFAEAEEAGGEEVAPATAGEAPADEAPAPATPPELAGIEVEDVLGLWRPVEGPQYPFVIVQADPDSEAYPYRLEAHTDKRVWKGSFTSFPPGNPARSQPARMVFHYTPQPREMNPEIPDWVTAAIDGHLKWRLEIDESGTLADPKLRVKWYRGEVRWTEGAERRAWIEGDGVPLVFELENETLLDMSTLSAPSLWLEPVGPAKPVAERITAVLKRQPFRVRLRLPPALAREAGPEIRVEIKGLTGGDTTSLVMRGPRVTTDRGLHGIVYTHDGDIVIADLGAEANRDPQVGSLEWISRQYERTSEEGKRIDLEVDDRELVEFRYGETFQQIVVYNNWMTRGMDQHWDAAQLYRAGFAKTVSDNNAPRAEREHAVYAIRLIDNYLALRAREDLLDIHKFYLGELYVSERGISGTHATCIGTECGLSGYSRPLVMVSKAQLGALMRDLSWPSPEPAYFTTLVEGFVEALKGEELEPAARRVGDAVNWTSLSERLLVAGTLAGASNQVRHTLQDTVGQMVYAIPQKMAEDIKIILFGRDLKNRRVVGWERDVTAARTIANLLLNAVQPRIAKGIAKLRSDALRRLGAPRTRWTLIRMRGVTERAAQSAAADAGGGVARLTDDMPASLSETQRRQIALQLESDTPDTGGPRCARPRLRTDNPIEIDAELLDAEHTARNLYRGLDVRLETGRLRTPQNGGTCVAVTGDYILNKRTAIDLGETGVLIEATEAAPEVLKRRAERAQRRMMAANDSERHRNWEFINAYNERQRFAGKSPSEVLQDMFDDGVPLSLMRHVLREHGADVAKVPVRMNGRTNLRHMKALIDNDYDLMVGIDLSDLVGEPNAFHAISVTGFEMQGGRIARVKFFEPNVGGVVSLPAHEFERLIARTKVDGRDLPWSNMLVIKWDGRPWPSRGGN
jgi:hypothetical protein